MTLVFLVNKGTDGFATAGGVSTAPVIALGSGAVVAGAAGALTLVVVVVVVVVAVVVVVLVLLPLVSGELFIAAVKSITSKSNNGNVGIFSVALAVLSLLGVNRSAPL